MDELSLRPVGEGDLAIMEKLVGDPATTGEFAWLGWWDTSGFRKRWAENRMLTDEGGSLMVVRGDVPLGFVSWHRRRTARTSYCLNMGIALLPEARGHGYGTEAHRMLARYLFAHTTTHRIEADTETDNIAEQRALEKAGFTREGVLRGGGWRDGAWRDGAWRDGAWRDGVIYSLLRTDPPV